MNLNDIEHGIIRKKFDEPRIHFALVCAAKSCPPLRNEAFTADQLNKQLDEQGRDFMNDKSKNNIRKDKAELSKILMWYGGDFTKKMLIVEWVNKYSTVKIDNSTPVSYMDYDWELNGK
jgi:ribosomal protein L15